MSSASTQTHLRGLMPDFMASATDLMSSPGATRTMTMEKAMEPMYTTDTTGERSGMGFSFMEAFMDEVEVESKVGCGTCVTMKKRIGRGYMNKEQEEKETAESYG